MYLVFSIRLFSIANLFAVRHLWDVCYEDKCCVDTHHAVDIRVAWLVDVRTYCVPIATLNQNRRSRLLCLGDAQIIKIKTSFRGETSGDVEKCQPFSQITLIGSE